MTEMTELTQAEAALAVIDVVFGLKHRDPVIVRRLHSYREFSHWYDAEEGIDSAAILQDAQKSQLLIDALNQALTYNSIPNPSSPRERADSITERQVDIIRARFGFEGRVKTLQELATEYKVSAGRIRQLEAGALRRLRSPSRRDFFTPVLGLLTARVA